MNGYGFPDAGSGSGWALRGRSLTGSGSVAAGVGAEAQAASMLWPSPGARLPVFGITFPGQLEYSEIEPEIKIGPESSHGLITILSRVTVTVTAAAPAGWGEDSVPRLDRATDITAAARRGA